MDAKDVRIFCEMAFKYLDYSAFKRRHVSPSEIGRKLGLDEKTVRLRVRKMEEEGFVKYYQAIPNLSLFGLRSMGFYSFEAADIASKYDALSYLRAAPGIVETFDMLGPGFLATLAGTSSEEVQEKVDRIADDLKLKMSMKVGDRIPRPPLRLPDKLGWRIIQRLRYDALCSAKDIADALSVTPRVAEYRITKLLESGAFFIRAILDAQRQQGLIFYALLVSVDDAKKSRVVGKLKDTFGEKLWSLSTPMKGVIVANVFGFTTGEPERAVLSTLKHEGVSQCSFAVFKEMIESERPNWMDGLIDRQI